MTVSVNCFSQNLLTADWKFNTGDTIEWAKQNFVDTDWKIINPRSAWEQQGYTNYDGYAWYRIIFSAPISLQAQAVKYKGLTLNLGTIDDADEIFLNGEKIAAHGKFPPNYITAYNEKRILNLASDKIKWNEPNCIAIRVYDNGGLGGIAGEDMTLLANSALDAVVLKINFVEENRVLINPKKVSIPIEITNNVMDETQSGKITTNVYTDFGDKVFELTKNINLKATH